MFCRSNKRWQVREACDLHSKLISESGPCKQHCPFFLFFSLFKWKPDSNKLIRSKKERVVVLKSVFNEADLGVRGVIYQTAIYPRWVELGCLNLMHERSAVNTRGGPVLTTGACCACRNRILVVVMAMECSYHQATIS